LKKVMGELKARSLLFSVVDFGLTFAPDLVPPVTEASVTMTV